MADYSVTAANVAPGSDGVFDWKNAGATITQGQPMYVDTSDTWQLADANGAAALRVATHMSLGAASSGQPLRGQRIIAGQSFTPGFTMTIGVPVVLSGNVGRVAPVADATTSGWYLDVLMVPDTTTVAKFVGVYSSTAA